MNKDTTFRKNLKMFVCNVLLKCPKNLVKDILKDGHKEISELFCEEDIQQLLFLPEDLPSVNINMAKRLDRLKITQISVYIFLMKYFLISYFHFLVNF